MKFPNPIFCEELTNIIKGRLVGNVDHPIIRISRIEDAQSGDISFISNVKYEKFIETTGASCLIIPENMKSELPSGKAYIITTNPYFEFVKLIKYIHSFFPVHVPERHQSAIIHESANISDNASIGPYCVIGKNCFIGENAILYPHVILYENVKIGEGSILHSSVVCYQETVIGKNCLIHSGAVIGADGFGFIENKDGSFDKIPQLGNVVIMDNVEIGANSTIDRSIVGSTIVEKGVKIDNLVQIGHNVSIGENTGMAAQVGISGSSKVGKRNRLGGQVGLAGHLETADDVIILAQSGAHKSVPQKGIYFGSPIKERFKAFKIEAAINQLPELVLEVEHLKKKMQNDSSGQE